jgi:hypothetical protein
VSGESPSVSTGSLPPDVTFRSWRSSVLVAMSTYVFLFIAAAFPVAMTSASLWVLAAIPVPFTAWIAGRLSVGLGSDEVVIVNPLRTHRLRTVTAAMPADRGPRGSAGCIVFNDANGRSIPAWAMSLFHASPANNVVTSSVAAWARAYGSRQGVEVQLDPNYRAPETVRRERYARVRAETSLIDPLESIGTVRNAFVSGLLYSIVTSSEGFKVVADSEDGARLYESVDYPTLAAAVSAAREQIANRVANPHADR